MRLLLIVFSSGLIVIFFPNIYKFIRRRRTRRVIIPYKTLGIASEEMFWKEKVFPLIEEYSRRQEISKSIICDLLMISEREIIKLVKRYANSGFTKLVGIMRIEYATLLLEQTNMSIIDIAGESGFGSLSRFNSLFKKIKGIPPTEYRRQNHEN